MTHNFILEISPPSGVTEAEAADALYAGCSDATLCVSNGRWELEFDREAITMLDAILSAKRDIARSGLKTRVLKVNIPNNPSKLTRIACLGWRTISSFLVEMREILRK